MSAPAVSAGPGGAAIAWDKDSGITGAGAGSGINEAEGAAFTACRNNGGAVCEVKISEIECVAAALGPAPSNSSLSVGEGPTLQAAKDSAIFRAPPVGQYIVRDAICPPAPAENAPPAAPAAAGTDTDGDGLADRDEIGRLTNIFIADTDLDGVSDGDEVKNGTNPLVIFDN